MAFNILSSIIIHHPTLLFQILSTVCFCFLNNWDHVSTFGMNRDNLDLLWYKDYSQSSSDAQCFSTDRHREFLNSVIRSPSLQLHNNYVLHRLQWRSLLWAKMSFVRLLNSVWSDIKVATKLNGCQTSTAETLSCVLVIIKQNKTT